MKIDDKIELKQKVLDEAKVKLAAAERAIADYRASPRATAYLNAVEVVQKAKHTNEYAGDRFHAEREAALKAWGFDASDMTDIGKDAPVKLDLFKAIDWPMSAEMQLDMRPGKYPTGDILHKLKEWVLANTPRVVAADAECKRTYQATRDAERALYKLEGEMGRLNRVRSSAEYAVLQAQKALNEAQSERARQGIVAALEGLSAKALEEKRKAARAKAEAILEGLERGELPEFFKARLAEKSNAKQ